MRADRINGHKANGNGNEREIEMEKGGRQVLHPPRWRLLADR